MLETGRTYIRGNAHDSRQRIVTRVNVLADRIFIWPQRTSRILRKNDDMLAAITLDESATFLQCYAEHVEDRGVDLYVEAARRELEGIVAKRYDAPYVAGRSSGWVKIKTAAGRERDSTRAEDVVV